MKLFRRLLSATVLNSLIIIYVKNLGQKVDHLKFRIDLIEGLLVKHSMQHKLPGRKGEGNTVKGLLIKQHFP